MRCSSCGTDNAPDSRFCGGCGARLAVSDQRVAPTQKISDDASFPQRQLAPAGGSAVPVTAPGVVAPRPVPVTPFVPRNAPVQRPLPTPPAAPSWPLAAPSSAPPRTISAPPDAYPGAAPSSTRDAARPSRPPPQSQPPQPQRIDDPSLSLPIVARRPWGLIIVVLLIDIGLAVTGAWMLSQGLGDRSGGAARAGARPPAAAATPRTVELTPIEPARPAAARAGSDTSAAATGTPADASVATGAEPTPPRSR